MVKGRSKFVMIGIVSTGHHAGKAVAFLLPCFRRDRDVSKKICADLLLTSVSYSFMD